MRSLRAENLKNTNDITRLTEKHAEAKRKLEIAEASEASMKTQLKSADAAVRGLKEEVARTKSLVSQARSACATEVRRRDRQIDTLKKQLGEAGRARGSRGNPAVTTITVAGDMGDDKCSPNKGTSTSADEYDLRNETNAFLANLARNLSEENEAVINAMRHTLQRLRNMSGWNNDERTDSQVIKQQSWEDMSADMDSVLDHMRNILNNPSFVPIEEVEIRETEINRLKAGWVKMESRWEEAVHLIDGWRKRMAANGRPVCEEELQMGLRLSPVRVSDVEETRQSHNFNLSAVVEEPEEEEEEEMVQDSPCPSPSRRTAVVEEYEQYHEDSDVESSFDDHVDIDEYDVEEPNVEILHHSTGGPIGSSPLPAPPQISPLRDSATAGNRGNLRVSKPRDKHGDFTTIIEENTRDLANDSRPPPPPPHRLRLTPQPSRSNLRNDFQLTDRGRSVSSSSMNDVLLVRSPEKTSQHEAEAPRSSARLRQPSSERPAPVETERPRSTSRRPQQSPERTSVDSDRGQETPTRSPRRVASRLPLPRNAEAAAQQSPLTMATIAAKLAASEREADAARVRAKLKAARGARGVKKPTLTVTEPEPEPEPKVEEPSYAEPTMFDPEEDVDPVKHDPAPPGSHRKPEKRRHQRKTSRAASRRRSTLSPWELQSLITGDVQ